jgi:hypothetical protein
MRKPDKVSKTNNISIRRTKKLFHDGGLRHADG